MSDPSPSSALTPELTSAIRLTEWLRNVIVSVDWGSPHGPESVVVRHIATELAVIRAQALRDSKECCAKIRDAHLAAAQQAGNLGDFVERDRRNEFASLVSSCMAAIGEAQP